MSDDRRADANGASRDAGTWIAPTPPAEPGGAPRLGAPDVDPAHDGRFGPGPLAADLTPPGAPRRASAEASKAAFPVPTFRPGVVTLRPMTIPDMVDGAVRAMRRRPAVFLGVGGAVVAASTVVRTLIDAGIGTTLIDQDGVPTATLTPSIAVLPVVAALLAGLLAVPTGQAVLGRPLDTASLRRQLRGRLAPLAAYLALVALACALPVTIVWWGWGGRAAHGEDLAFALGGLAMAAELARVPFVAVPAAIVLERQGPWAAVRRSWMLVRGSYFRALWVGLLGRLLTVLVQVALVVPLLLLSGVASAVTGASAQTVAQVAAITALYGMVTACLTMPYEATLRAVLYVDLRSRAEGWDVSLVRAGHRVSPP
ncbi:MAG: hypothetical protein ABI746_04440 [Dermatophilaceae bacterium]